MIMNTKDKPAAIVTIFDAPNMTKAGRRQIAEWLRERADLLEAGGDTLSKRFVSRWLVRRDET